MKSVLLLFWVAFVLPWSAHSQTAINITTFNLKWFGTGGSPSNTQKEPRIPYIKNLISSYLANTHIFVFEEVVVVNDLLQILPQGWQCLSYAHPQPQHQKVAICATPAVTMAKVNYDDNFTIESVQVGNSNLRPAVRIDIIEKKTNRNLFTLVGVHLKAMPNETSMRVQQSIEISKDLARIPLGKPVVIVGDMNTFTRSETKQAEDDVELLLKAFNSSAKGILRVPHKANTYTFRSPEYRNQLDHFYVRGSMRVTAYPDVFPVCSANQNGSGYMNFEYYYNNVSDHCPVTMQIQVNPTAR